MLTIFTTAKPFRGHLDVIQRNALRSWTLLVPRCQIVLIGNDAGTAEAAREFGALHIPEVSRTEQGMPLVADLFRLAEAHSATPWMCFVNADVILMQDFVEAATRVAKTKKRFLMVGRRWNLDVTAAMDFGIRDWDSVLRRNVKEHGELFYRDAMDYFVFPRGSYTGIPPLAVGREGWDNWMIYEARRKLAPVVDVTPSVVAVHQNHDFGKFRDVQERRESDETRRNKEFVGVGLFDLRDATHELVAGVVRPVWKRNFRWHLWRACLVFPGLRYVLLPLSRVRNFLLRR